MAHDIRHVLDREAHRNQVLLGYFEALEQGKAPDRAQLLAAYPDLRGDLEAFLDGHEALDRITAPLRQARKGDAGSLSGDSSAPSTGAQTTLGELGDFRLLREVGRGGMGVGYEAEQISLRRRVALKILPFAAAIDPRRLQRFKTEALAAAHVQHERIVPVHAVGCERGVHYYAMQFIDGQSLAALVAELRAERDELAAAGARTEFGQGRAALSPDAGLDSAATTIARERSGDRIRYFGRMAALGRQAARALEHAHQAGIVHRDVKPGNLLLDVRGQLWITDFGLAQVTGDEGLTISGEMLGTLRYASPEQVLAQRRIVDHRSDVYSLGATLYELLTLRPPFDGRDRHTLIRQIVEDEPASPRALEPSIPERLETIVLKALRKEPAERYASAQEMADDLERFLQGRPILARRPTVAERLRAWMRKHPALVGSGIAALVLLLAASLVSMAMLRREQARTLVEQHKAEAAYLREHDRAEEAEERFRMARRAVDELIRASEEELAHRPGTEGLRKRLLASALAYYREFLAEQRSDPELQADLLDTTRRVESILSDLAALRAAGQLFLLVQQAAMDDLKLDEDQRKRVAELSNHAVGRWRAAFGDPAHRPPPADRARIALEHARANEAEVDSILSTPQRLRLRQLALQAEGPGAFREPEVVEALGLSPAQRERIRGIEEDAFFGQFRDAQSRAGSESTEHPAMKRILGVLTPQQARVWQNLVGTPVAGHLSSFPFPFRRREPSRPGAGASPQR